MVTTSVQVKLPDDQAVNDPSAVSAINAFNSKLNAPAPAPTPAPARTADFASQATKDAQSKKMAMRLTKKGMTRVALLSKRGDHTGFFPSIAIWGHFP